MRSRVIALLLALLAALRPAVAQTYDPNFREAARAFLSLELNTRLWFQIFLTSAGHWPAVPNVNFSRRLFEATKDLQRARGENPNGILTKAQVGQMLESASSVLKGWDLRWVPHPTRGRSVWVPMGLGLSATRTEHGVQIWEPRNRFKLRFNYYPFLDVKISYDINLREMVRNGDNINFKVLKNDFFVITGNQGRYNRYVRYHTEGGGPLVS